MVSVLSCLSWHSRYELGIRRDWADLKQPYLVGDEALTGGA
jgi:hypothetical protein